MHLSSSDEQRSAFYAGRCTAVHFCTLLAGIHWSICSVYSLCSFSCSRKNDDEDGVGLERIRHSIREACNYRFRMDPAVLAQLEEVCEAMYSSANPAKRTASEQMLRGFGAEPDVHIPQCQAILDGSQNPFAQHFAAATLTRLLTVRVLVFLPPCVPSSRVPATSLSARAFMLSRRHSRGLALCHPKSCSRVLLSHVHVVPFGNCRSKSLRQRSASQSETTS